MILRNLCDPLLAVRIIIRYRSLLKQQIVRNLAARYRGSALGAVWSLVYPLMMLSVYTFVFSVVFKTRWGLNPDGGSGSFAVIMFCGMAVYNIFSESINTCSSLIPANSNLVKKVIFPLELLPLASVVSTVVLGLVWFVLLLLGVLLIQHQLFWTMLLLPATLVPLTLFTLGISYFVASLGVYLRDLPYLVGVVTQILFFMTPIFYPLEIVPEKFRPLLQLNPLTALVEQTRNLFLFRQAPDWLFCIQALLISFVFFQMGLVWFLKTKKGFADVL
ncbi:MAG: ABC transporter permease [Deltaproteobacteria bacterium]|nr:ABC transporter permease [Deltaproteobacteria bacterium]